MNTKSSLDIFLGQKIRSIRNKLRWPLKKLSVDVKVSIQQLQRYEQGDNRLSAIALFDISRAFKVPVDALFEGYEGNQYPISTAHPSVLLIQDNTNEEFFIKEVANSFSKKINVHSMHSDDKVLNYCRNFGSGIDVLYQYKPDIIILDIEQGNDKFISLLKEIKRHKVLNTIPIVVISSIQSDDIVQKCMSFGASTFISKSASLNLYKKQLIHILTYWLEISILPQN